VPCDSPAEDVRPNLNLLPAVAVAKSPASTAIVALLVAMFFEYIGQVA
jgi:hypothetical protein